MTSPSDARADWLKLLFVLGELHKLLKTGDFPTSQRSTAETLAKFERQASEMHKYTFDLIFKP